MTSEGASEVVASARDAYARRDFGRLGDIVARHPLEFWFGMPPAEVHTVLAAVPPATLRRHPTAGALLRVLSSAPVPLDLGADTVEAEQHGGAPQFEQRIVLLQAAQARLAGDPVRAFATMRGLRVVADAVPHLIDPSRGGRTFALVQTAISGMLAGRFSEALVLFEKSLTPQLPPGLAFLNRDAHVRSALIHALYGDPRRADTHLAASRRVPRTQSWVEGVLDTDERLVVALLRPAEEASAAFDEVAAVPASQMGELWPFHVATIHRLALVADRVDDGRRRLVELEAAGLVRRDGAGYSGSIFPTTLGLDALLGGAVSRAEQMADAADARIWPTKLLLATLAVARGAHARGLRLARAASTQTRDLLQAEAARLLVVALAHHRLGEEAEALASLEAIPPGTGQLGGAVLARFAPGLLTVAAGRVPGWDVSRPAVVDAAALGQLVLTERELQVLTRLAAGESREEIARSLFLSVNTVKTHHRSLYRKLRATNASEAIREGRRRGLV